MYSVFELPDNFLSHEYTEPEKSFYDKKLTEAIYGPEALSEELTADQKSRVDSWGNVDPEVKKLHDRVFGDSDRIVIPYDSSNEEPVTSSNYRTVPEIRNVFQIHHHKILDALHRHGYRTDDYVSGRVYHMDTPEKKIKIMQALQETGEADNLTEFKSKPKYAVDEKGAYKLDKKGNKIIAVPPRPLTMAQVYAADPVRAASTKPKQIVITRNRYDVAGMSTGRGWRSCMHMEDGINRHYLPADMQQGTLTAYVATVAEPKAGEAPKDVLESPIGRINLKHFKSEDRGTSVFRPESSSYGTIPTNFRKNVTEWAEKNYPISAGVFTKHASLYNDDGKNIIIEQPDQLKGSEIRNAAMADADNKLNSARDVIDNLEYNRWGEPKNGLHPYEIFDSAKHQAFHTFDELHNKLNPKEFANSIIHHVSDHSYQFDGNDQGENKQKFDTADFDSRLDSDDVAHKWAIDAMSGGSSYKKFKEGINHMTPQDAIENLGKIHHAMKKTEDNDHPVLKEVHAALINHVLNSGDEFKDAKNMIVHHIADKKNSDYYYSMNEDHDVFSGNAHPVTFTKNPRTMHRIIDDYSESPAGDSEAMHHIGKHADSKLADHVLTSKDFADPDGENDINFMHGLNENKHGEKIQHRLIGTSPQMSLHLTGGEYRGYGDLLPVKNKQDLAYAVNTKYMHRTHPVVKPDDEHINKIARIAEMTKFPSVYNSIKERATSGDLDHPLIHSALNDNWDMRDKKIDESFISFAKYRQSKGR